ncbi:hypothetical protein [Neorhodopirellula pilleata]|uniref:hypothetical protein n=1 Tax=Neorhodopirellula pilleata TaxID=2714738 RepID=UPI001E48BECF|nr:hypothetical protein [Neorhodopirellula pilleata]
MSVKIPKTVYLPALRGKLDESVEGADESPTATPDPSVPVGAVAADVPERLHPEPHNNKQTDKTSQRGIEKRIVNLMTNGDEIEDVTDWMITRGDRSSAINLSSYSSALVIRSG